MRWRAPDQMVDQRGRGEKAVASAGPCANYLHLTSDI